MNKEKIVVTKTPLRISFIGGGTDMPYFYNKNGGVTLVTSINKYVYVMVKIHSHSEEKYRFNYFHTEHANTIDDIKNLRIKETLKHLQFYYPLYVNTISDLPSNTGLGSSSAFTVGLINAISCLKGVSMSKYQLAETAFKIEKKIVGESLGKQDHYAAAFGGINEILYTKKKIIVKPIVMSKKNINLWQKSCVLFWTKIKRSADSILKNQRKNYCFNLQNLIRLKILANNFIKEIRLKKIDIKKISHMVAESWKLKKTFSQNITNKKLDLIYEKSLSKGIFGGKLLGAGNGGFFLFLFSYKKNNYRLHSFLKNNLVTNFKFEKNGSTIILEK